jgi:DNA modification methylase
VSPLRNEGDLIRTLEAGTYTLREVYRLAEQGGLADRAGGRKRIQDGQEQYKRRVRSALCAARKQGRIRYDRDGGNEAMWLVEGSREQPRRALFVWLPGERHQLELVLGAATDVLARCEEPIDLILADPPYGLGRGKASSGYQRTYERDHSKVVPGYVDVEHERYADFTAEWVAAASEALRPGGYLAVVTGPEQSADVQIAAREAGLTYVNSIVAPRKFGMRTTRRFVHQHWRVTLACRGPLTSKRRTFHVLPEFPLGRNGGEYPIDVWPAFTEVQRRELLRYDNSLPWELPAWVIRSTTNPDDLVADPFLGGGAMPEACLWTDRRFYGGDLNPNSLRYTMGRILAEVVPAINAAAGRPTRTEEDEFGDLLDLLLATA